MKKEVIEKIKILNNKIKSIKGKALILQNFLINCKLFTIFLNKK